MSKKIWFLRDLSNAEIKEDLEDGKLHDFVNKAIHKTISYRMRERAYRKIFHPMMYNVPAPIGAVENIKDILLVEIVNIHTKIAYGTHPQRNKNFEKYFKKYLKK